MQIQFKFWFQNKANVNEKVCQTLDKEEKRYDIFSSIGYRCIYKMSASKVKKLVT